MCGSFSLGNIVWDQAVRLYPAMPSVPLWGPVFRIVPGTDVPVFSSAGIYPARWGFLPPGDLTGGKAMINARSETATEKPSFRLAMRSGRCLVPANGYFEWKRDEAAKIPHYIFTASPMFFMAGILDGRGGFALLTRAASPELAVIHDRMPVIARPDTAGEWLGPDTDRAFAFITRAMISGFKFHRVSRDIYRRDVRDPAIVEPDLTVLPEQGSLF